MPTAIGPLTQFMLNPLKNPFKIPSFLKEMNRQQKNDQLIYRMQMFFMCHDKKKHIDYL